MQIAIEIPEAWIEEMKREEFIEVDALCECILNGTPLPKYHGDLKDVSKLVYDCSYNDGNGCDRICHCDDCVYHVVRESDIKTLSTIIPATE